MGETPQTARYDVNTGVTGRRAAGDYHKGMDAGSLALSISNHLKYSLAKDHYSSTVFDRFKSVAHAIRDRLVDRWMATQRAYYDQDVKRAYYLSMEYLPGRLLRDSIINLGLAEEFQAAVQELGLDVKDVMESEPDMGLGNGGLGRLASCLMESLATLQMPVTGYGLRYEFGMFRQVIRDGWQEEEPDHWLRFGSPWELERPEWTYPVRFYGNTTWGAFPDGRPRREWVNAMEIWATPSDIPVPGYRNNTVNNLRLWAARGTDLFDYDYFYSGG